MMKCFKAIFLALFLCTVMSSDAFSAEIEGIVFDDTYSAGDTVLEARGVGLVRYMGFIKVYVAALYLKKEVPSKEVLSDTPMRLEINYFRSFTAEDFARSTSEMISRNVDEKTFEKLRSAIEKMNSLYEDVKPGERYSLTYLPGRGTELALNRVPKGVVEGAEFASAMFSIWLGKNPISDSLRESLLGSN